MTLIYPVETWIFSLEAEAPVCTKEDSLEESLLDSLLLIYQGRAWKVETTRLETLINKGLVNALGTALTPRGKEILSGT